jgi:hypothetical protein
MKQVLIIFVLLNITLDSKPVDIEFKMLYFIRASFHLCRLVLYVPGCVKMQKNIIIHLLTFLKQELIDLKCFHIIGSYASRRPLVWKPRRGRFVSFLDHQQGQEKGVIIF